ncbi:MAG: hypothetical protein RL318_81 [Fibrobacterota bacterium]|jgi:pimeloyl-ACP methyl ester carboxylesterase
MSEAPQSQFQLNRLEELYSTLAHHKIVPGNDSSAPVFLFFSGNALYFPNTDEVLERTIIHSDRYEWENILSQGIIPFSFAIFVRDIKKTWYSEGISAQYPDIDALLGLLKTLIPDGRKLVCVGNSAGGYAATLFGILLGAERIINVSGFVLLGDDLCSGAENPALNAAMQVEKKRKWFDLRPLLATGNCDIYHIYPVDSAMDQEQHAILSRYSNVHAFPVASSRHGDGAPGYIYPYLLSFSNERMRELAKRLRSRAWTPFALARCSLGLWGALRARILRKIRRLRIKYSSPKA